jgi:hypothetical protein
MYRYYPNHADIGRFTHLVIPVQLSQVLNTDKGEHSVHWRWPLSGVCSVMMVFRQLAEGGGVHALPHSLHLPPRLDFHRPFHPLPSYTSETMLVLFILPLSASLWF